MAIKFFPSVFIWIFNKNQCPSILREKKLSLSTKQSKISFHNQSSFETTQQPKRKFRKSPRMKKHHR